MSTESIIKAPISGELLPPALETRLARREQKKRRGKGSGYLFQRGAYWYAQFYVAGDKRVVATKTKVKQEAQAILNTILGKVAAGLQPPKSSRAVRIAELYDALLISKQGDCKASTVKWIELVWNAHLKPVFGDAVAQGLRKTDFEKYSLQRMREGASVCTRNREITILKMIFKHALDNETIAALPKFPDKMNERPFIRRGTIDVEQYKALMAKAEPWLAALVTVHFKYGFRESELLKMQVRDVDLKVPMLTLPPFRAKNNEPRETVIQKGGKIFQMVSELVEGKSPDDYVFTRPNSRKRIKDYRRAWDKLVEGLTCGSGRKRVGNAWVPTGKVTVHDLRRS